MNLTYIIGNGFDLGLGLPTSYKEFLKHYLENGNTDNVHYSVQKLKEEIEKDIDNWGDGEVAIGRMDYRRFSRYYDKQCIRLDDPELPNNILIAYDDIKRSLYEYIKQCENLFPAVLSDIETSRFRTCLVTIYKALPDPVSGGTFYNNAERIDVNCLNFNYTNTYSKLIGKSGCSSIIKEGNWKASVHFHAPIHVHGEISVGCWDDIVFGIGSKAQFAHMPKVSESHTIETVYEQIAPNIVKHDKDIILESEYKEVSRNPILAAIKVLRESDVIILFGISLSITDGIWLCEIARRALNDDCVKVIYSPYYLGRVKMNSKPNRWKDYVSNKVREALEDAYGFNGQSEESMISRVVRSLHGKIQILRSAPLGYIDEAFPPDCDPLGLSKFNEKLQYHF